VIEGTRQGGDVIVAGAGNDTIRARNGHRDLISCGPGRDVVRADRADRLNGCENVVRR
jgi:hemolysin type calcium-binding protein